MTEALSLRMKELARERNVSINEIIKRGEINQSTISEIMAGRSKHPRISTIQKFCKGCGITMSEFFSSPYFDEAMETSPAFHPEILVNNSTTENHVVSPQIESFVTKAKTDNHILQAQAKNI